VHNGPSRGSSLRSGRLTLSPKVPSRHGPVLTTELGLSAWPGRATRTRTHGLPVGFRAFGFLKVDSREFSFPHAPGAPTPAGATGWLRRTAWALAPLIVADRWWCILERRAAVPNASESQQCPHAKYPVRRCLTLTRCRPVLWRTASSRQSRVNQLDANRREAGAQPSSIDDQTASELAKTLFAARSGMTRGAQFRRRQISLVGPPTPVSARTDMTIGEASRGVISAPAMGPARRRKTIGLHSGVHGPLRPRFT
jgi:hypothetical protein